MKKWFFKILSVLMTCLVLLSTFSFAVESHFCGDYLVDRSLFGSVESCGMETQNQDNSTECDWIKKDCCTNETYTIDGQEELKVPIENLNLQQQVFIASFVYTYINFYSLELENKIPYRDYSPPLLTRDVQILDQTFLI